MPGILDRPGLKRSVVSTTIVPDPREKVRILLACGHSIIQTSYEWGRRANHEWAHCKECRNDELRREESR